MNAWGKKLLDAVQDVAEMAAVGFDLPADTFRGRMQRAPHLLAPTASNFNKFGAKGTVRHGDCTHHSSVGLSGAPASHRRFSPPGASASHCNGRLPTAAPTADCPLTLPLPTAH